MKTICNGESRPQFCHFLKNNIKPCCLVCKMYDKCITMYDKLSTASKIGPKPCRKEFYKETESFKDCEYFGEVDISSKCKIK